MSNRTPTIFDDENFIQGWIRQLRLAWNLFWDPRVSGWTKAIPILAVLYLLSPVDIIPNAVVPIIGGLDDVAVMLLGLKLLIEFSPPEVVKEYLQKIGGAVSGWRDVSPAPQSEPAAPGDKPVTVIEAEYRVVEEADGNEAVSRGSDQ